MNVKAMNVTATERAPIAPNGASGRLHGFVAGIAAPLALALALPSLLVPADGVLAAGSRAAVEARPGEIVVLRTVPVRHAARPMPPGRALLVDPSPRSELEQGLSHLEISAGGYGQVSASPGNGPAAPVGLGGAISSITQQIGGTASGGHSAPSAAGGSIGAATGSIGSTVTGALSGAGLIGKGGTR